MRISLKSERSYGLMTGLCTRKAKRDTLTPWTRSALSTDATWLSTVTRPIVMSSTTRPSDG